MKLPDLPAKTDWIIYSACAPDYAPRCVIWSKDRKVCVSETGKSVSEAVKAAVREFKIMKVKRFP